MSLNLRKSADGVLTVTGGVPEHHIFATSFIERALASESMVVTIELRTADGPVLYKLAGLVGEDGLPNTTAWSCDLMGS
jgi:hypothetical protein